MKTSDFENRIDLLLDKPEIKSAVIKATDTSLKKRDIIVDSETNWEELRSYAAAVKKNTINHLSSYIQEAESKLLEAGAKVLWAIDDKEACHLVYRILTENNVKRVVKAKSMITEEIHLNKFLEKRGLEIFETDLGEYIVQIANEKPSHITAPALHKTRKDIAKLFTEIHNIDYTEEAEELTAFSRKFLRDKFFSAQAGISGANFLIADSGTLVLVENEGNIRFSTTTPDIHIAILGIEKLIPSFESAGVFLRILATSATGQKIPTYISFLTPSELLKNEKKQLFVIFLDNGRTELLKDEKFKQALHCIKCGCCMNICPVYRRASGHAYNSTYPGPIGSIISTYLFGYDKYGDLAFGSTLCGRCTEICPVKIDLSHLIVTNRNYANNKKSSYFEKFIFKLFSKITTDSKTFNFITSFFKVFSNEDFYSKFIKGWNKERTLPKVPPKRFRDIFKSE